MAARRDNRPMFLDKFTHIGGDTGRSIRGSSSLVADKEYPSQVVEGKFVSFELTACKNANREVKCSLRVKAKNEDRELSIGSYYAGKTRVFDENGTEYYLSNIKVGDKSDPKYVKKHLIAGVAVPSEVSFGPLPSEVSNLTAMEIFYHASFSKSIKFKNIPVQ